MSNRYPPGPKGHFFYGIMREFAIDQLAFLQMCRREFGNIAHMKFLWQHVYTLNHPDYIRDVLVTQADAVEKTPMLKRSTRRVLGEGLLTSDGAYHDQQRRLVQPAFHAQRIEAYADVIVEFTLRMLKRWQTDAVYDMDRQMMKLTLDVVAKTLFDADVSDEADAIGDAITTSMEFVMDRLQKPLPLIQLLPTEKNRQRRAAAKLLENTIQGIIARRRIAGDDRGDLLSMLLLSETDSGAHMTDKQVRDEAITLFIAGHETTANALSWSLHLLATHPDIAERLKAELDTVLAGQPPTIRDLACLPYTEMVVKEAMRLYPPAWVITRRVMRPLEIGGWTLPRNSVVIISPYVMHHDERYFPQPDEFRPERFSPEVEDSIPRYVYFPFGGGPRVCIGNSFAMMEARLILATIMQLMDVSSASENVRPQPLITLRPQGLKLRVRKRESLAVSYAKRDYA